MFLESAGVTSITSTSPSSTAHMVGSTCIHRIGLRMAAKPCDDRLLELVHSLGFTSAPAMSPNELSYLPIFV